MSAARYLRFPVRKTGVYVNDQKSELEFWIFNPANGKKKQIGACKMSAPQYMKDKWEDDTAVALKAHLATHFAMKGKKQREAAHRIIVKP